jgi:uncharacterized caspase-like protein
MSFLTLQLFYFAGHGVQVAGQNYLLPIRTSITAETDVKYKAVPTDWVLERVVFYTLLPLG